MKKTFLQQLHIYNFKTRLFCSLFTLIYNACCCKSFRGTKFVRCFLLSLESQTTIGYGARYPLDKCTWPPLVQSAQYILNLILMGHIILIVTQRMIKRRNLNLIQFTNCAVICERKDRKGTNRLCLVLRMAPKENLQEVEIVKMLK